VRFLFSLLLFRNWGVGKGKGRGGEGREGKGMGIL